MRVFDFRNNTLKLPLFVRSSQHPHCFCFRSLSGHFRLSLFIFSQIAKTSRNRNSLPSTRTMVGADPSQLTRRGLLVAFFQENLGPARSLSSFTPSSPSSPPPRPHLHELKVTLPTSLHASKLNRETASQMLPFFYIHRH